MKEKKDVLETVRERIQELRDEFMTDPAKSKLAGKRKGQNLEELEDKVRNESESDQGSDGDINEKPDQGKDDNSNEEEEEEGEGEEISGEDLEEILEGSDQESEKEGQDESKEKPEFVEADVAEKEELERESSSDSESVKDDLGFVNEADINTFRKPKAERIQEQLSQQIKEKYNRGKKKKKGSTTNTEKLKHKPYMMVQPKKSKDILHSRYKSVKERIKDLERRLGKVRKGKIKVNQKIYVRA